MRVPGGKISLAGARPVFEARADRFAPMIIFGGAGGVFDTGQFQRFPEITDKPAGNLPELVVQRVSLMPVQQVDAPPADRVFEDQGFDGGRQETGSRTGRRAKPGTAFDAVVIAPEQEQPSGSCKIHQLGKDIAVDLGNIRDIAIFP